MITQFQEICISRNQRGVIIHIINASNLLLISATFYLAKAPSQPSMFCSKGRSSFNDIFF